MEATVRTRPVLGVDVGKQSHRCCLVTADGEVALNAPVANREHDIDELLASLPGGTLVVVDQVRNISSPVLKRAEAAGLERAYLPGIAMHGASKLFAGDAKTDERDALARSDNRFGDFYRKCRDRGMPHGKALKAVARKRLKVIYAIMRDQVPYAV